MVKLVKKKNNYGPSSALGLLYFQESESKAPKLSPEFVLVVALAFAVIEIIVLLFL